MMQKKFIEEKGKWEGGKQWVHLYNTNVKSRATIEDIVLWEGEILTKEDMEALALAADPNFKPKGPSNTAGRIPSNTAGGIWKNQEGKASIFFRRAWRRGRRFSN